MLDSKATIQQIRCPLGFSPRPRGGAYNTPPNLQLYLRGLLLRGHRVKERGGKRKGGRREKGKEAKKK